MALAMTWLILASLKKNKNKLYWTTNWFHVTLHGCFCCCIISLVVYICCIFRPAFGCYACQTLVKIVIFSVFCAKNQKKPFKKARNLRQILAKNSFFCICTRTLVDCFTPKKWAFFSKNTVLSTKSCESLTILYNIWLIPKLIDFLMSKQTFYR